jgi:hypothetical protein
MCLLVGFCRIGYLTESSPDHGLTITTIEPQLNMNLSSKATHLAYWIFTILLAVMMTYSAAMELFAPALKDAFANLGFPDYFRIELGIAKTLGVIALLAPLPRWLREWAYAGFVICFISAIIAHLNVDGPGKAVAPGFALFLAVVSYFLFRKRKDAGGVEPAVGM